MSRFFRSEQKKPQYLTLYENLRENIIEKHYPEGSKLPSKRAMAEKTGLSVITVEHAYALLQEEGYITSREKSGYFVIFRESDFLSVHLPRPTPTPHLHREGLPGELGFSVLARTMRRVLTEDGDAILRKSPNAGIWQLREAISRYLARSRGINTSPEQIIIGSGAEYLYGFAVQLFGRERRYAIENPSYEKIEQVYRSFGAEVELLPLTEDGIDSVALFSSRADVLHVTPYRSFPSGVTASASKKREYLNWSKKGRFLIEDDFESEFTLSSKPEETLFSMTRLDNVVYVNTFSKTISASMRVGYMVLPKSLLPLFEKKLGFYSCTVPVFEQYVLTRLIESGEFERHIHRVRRLLRKG